MGSLVSGAGVFFITCLCSFLFGLSSIYCQDQTERDAICNAEGCYVVYFQRKTFLESWRDCKNRGGNLATIKRNSDAQTIASLFSTVDLRYSRTKVQVWIGLQRQPRQCTTQPLRGYSWTIGDQDTEYTNWLTDNPPNMCSVPRCVAMVYSTTEPSDNFKWIEGPCLVPVEAYLCYYGYQKMCAALPSEGEGTILYNTPFNLLSTILTHVPFGTVATVPCSDEHEETVLCMLQEDGSPDWSKDSPICLDVPLQYDWCNANGGCEHICKQMGEQVLCDCAPGYQLRQDQKSCELVDACRTAPCEYECLSLSDGYRCACPEGYMLAPDDRGCVDVDECLQSPCEQLCVNSPGTFQCTCREGYQPGEESECEDADECASDPCEHACENTPGSHICHCHLGFSPVPEDPSRCQDIDECQIAGICEQMCVNYEGGFECYCEVGYELMDDSYSCQKIDERNDKYVATSSFPWVTQQPTPSEDYDPKDYHWPLPQAHTNWPAEVDQSEDWDRVAPIVQDADVISVTVSPQDLGNANEEHNSPTEHTTKSEIDIEYSDTDLWLQLGDSLSENDATAVPISNTISPLTPLPSTSSDWYEAEEETTTALPPLLPTSTVSEGAWNWWITQPVNKDNSMDYIYDYNIPLEPEEMGPDSVISASPGAQEEEITEDYENITASYKPLFPTESNAPPDSSGVGAGIDLDPVQSDREASQSSTWLLVGLLVPICIFIIVMVALGIVYCTRCAAQSRSSKNTTDCYHWISGAHDKQAAANSSAGVKTHV